MLYGTLYTLKTLKIRIKRSRTESANSGMPRNEVLFTHDVTQIRILWILYIYI